MKVVTILGTRPELIRLCVLIPKLDDNCDHIIIHTGQNYDKNLDEIFFKELGIRKPNYHLGATGSFAEQFAKMMPPLEAILLKEKPDAFLVLGDTNSSLGAIMAKRLGIKVFHMEAGNRCYDDNVPEEVNRRLIDHASDILLPYTERSRQNLLAEGIEGRRIYVTGNPIYEVLDKFKQQIDQQQNDLEHFLITLHRQENVDSPRRLKLITQGFNELAEMYEMPLIWPVHPRTRKHLKNYELHPSIILEEPMGLFQFVGLEKSAYCVLTDSGTVQEECAIFGVPVVTLRDTTERPETVESGSNYIAGCEPDSIVRGVKLATSTDGEAPINYLTDTASDTVLKIVMGYNA